MKLCISEKEAKDIGFTHHASYFGIPVWLGCIDGELNASVKFLPAEPLFEIFMSI